MGVIDQADALIECAEKHPQVINDHHNSKSQAHHGDAQADLIVEQDLPRDRDHDLLSQNTQTSGR
jgi:hypothetical protein